MQSAGSDTSSNTIEWGLSELLRNPHVMQKVQAELDAVVGRHRLVQESDIPHLPYLQAVVKEVLRLHPGAPLMIPHVKRKPASWEATTSRPGPSPSSTCGPSPGTRPPGTGLWNSSRSGSPAEKRTCGASTTSCCPSAQAGEGVRGSTSAWPWCITVWPAWCTASIGRCRRGRRRRTWTWLRNLCSRFPGRTPCWLCPHLVFSPLLRIPRRPNRTSAGLVQNRTCVGKRAGIRTSPLDKKPGFRNGLIAEFRNVIA